MLPDRQSKAAEASAHREHRLAAEAAGDEVPGGGIQVGKPGESRNSPLDNPGVIS